MHERNTAGIEEAGKKRTQEKTEAALEAIENLRKRGILITFESVAAESKCSRAFLYKQPAIRKRIEDLRADTTNGLPNAPLESRITDASRDTIIKSLKSKIDRLTEQLTEERKKTKSQRHALEKALGEAQHWRDTHIKMMLRYEKQIASD
jgi:hypothetical protein